jgi:hypothetical protein
MIEKETVLNKVNETALLDIGGEGKILRRFLLANPLVLQLLSSLAIS